MKELRVHGPQGGSRMNPHRRHFMTTLALAVMAGPALAKTDAPLVEVWKDPSCGCCQDWVKHLQTNGFQVKIHDAGNTDARVMLGMPLEYGACHSARVKAYAIEGHVPAREIHRLLRETPAGHRACRARHARGFSRYGWPRIWQSSFCLRCLARSARRRHARLCVLPLNGNASNRVSAELNHGQTTNFRTQEAASHRYLRKRCDAWPGAGGFRNSEAHRAAWPERAATVAIR